MPYARKLPVGAGIPGVRSVISLSIGGFSWKLNFCSEDDIFTRGFVIPLRARVSSLRRNVYFILVNSSRRSGATTYVQLYPGVSLSALTPCHRDGKGGYFVVWSSTICAVHFRSKYHCWGGARRAAGIYTVEPAQDRPLWSALIVIDLIALSYRVIQSVLKRTTQFAFTFFILIWRYSEKFIKIVTTIFSMSEKKHAAIYNEVV